MSAELQPQCGSGRHDEYNTGQQVGGLLLILAVSVLGCAFPLAVKLWSWLPVPRHALFLCCHLGTGVIVATCFVHLVPTAFANLLDPCLPKFWTEDYPAMPGVIIMLGVLMIGGIDFFSRSRGVSHSHCNEFTNMDESHHEGTQPAEDSAHPTTARGPSGLDLEHGEVGKTDDEGLLRQCALLEAGILCHSIFIGMTIAFSQGTKFVALLIAISFHQIFEGLALGSRIAAIDHFGPRSCKPWLMVLAYGMTAPLGQAIGLAVHGTFDLASERGLLMVGIANAFSRYVLQPVLTLFSK